MELFLLIALAGASLCNLIGWLKVRRIEDQRAKLWIMQTALEEFTRTFEDEFIENGELTDNPNHYWHPLGRLYTQAKHALEEDPTVWDAETELFTEVS